MSNAPTRVYCDGDNVFALASFRKFVGDHDVCLRKGDQDLQASGGIKEATDKLAHAIVFFCTILLSDRGVAESLELKGVLANDMMGARGQVDDPDFAF